MLIDKDSLDLITYISLICLSLLAVIRKPLLACAIDPLAARIQGLPVRGIGLLIGLQLFNDQTIFIKKLMENRLLTIRAAENVIRILPPLNVKKREIDLALKIISKVCNQIK